VFVGWIGIGLLYRVLFGDLPPLKIKLNREGCLIVGPVNWMSFIDSKTRSGFRLSIAMCAVIFGVCLYSGFFSAAFALGVALVAQFVHRWRYLRRAEQYDRDASKATWYVAGWTHPASWAAIRDFRITAAKKGWYRLQIESELQHRIFVSTLLDAEIECTPERVARVLAQCKAWMGKGR